eukprot:TRINITY_DN5803_c0_g1_i1.p1 TRINITY_DN5803_c0_g1~~TRINITY_DN5803_c0_g1_i1.p1  ORF type:complete len:449 (+),score=116.78 TRINITY_DN5803_c0_g1_i1:162-1508(+)
MSESDVSTFPSFVAEPQAHVSVLQQLAQQRSEDAPFCLLDLGALHRRMELFQEHLPSVTPFYAVKCLPDPYVIKALASLGAGFDCASRAELELVLGLNVEPSHIVFANACKPASHIKFARNHGANLMTFDNEDELDKIRDVYSKSRPHPQLLLRVAVDDSHSVCRLGLKYGAAMSDVEALLNKAKQLDLPVVGVSFHVGSGCMSAKAYHEALVLAKDTINQAHELGFKPTILDIGGGFPGATTANEVLQGSDKLPVSFEAIASIINTSLAELFKDNELTVIAEPGRFFAASIVDLAVTIIARRLLRREQHAMYYINDGVYGSFNCLLYDHARVSGLALFPKKTHCDAHDNDDEIWSTSVWGPTCDSLDCVSKDAGLPLLGEGDWIYYRNMGAYTVAAASSFNGFAPPGIVYTYSTLPERDALVALPEDFPLRSVWLGNSSSSSSIALA